MYDTGSEDMTVEVRGYQEMAQMQMKTTIARSPSSNLATPVTDQQPAGKNDTYLLEVSKMLIPTNRKVRFRSLLRT